MARIKTRIFILSDTHGYSPSPLPADQDLTPDSDYTIVTTGYRLPLPAADVALHCGDLTTNTTPSEYQRTITMMRNLQAPLKILIAGNHDRALDAQFWNRERGGRGHASTSGITTYHHHYPPEYRAEVLQMLQDAKSDGVVYLADEGTHTFTLANGAILRIYASAYTPEYGVWAFQYHSEDGHSFEIPHGIDIAMTHGPPRGVLDLAGWNLPEHMMQSERAGCPDLFAAIARARPQMHCFGHIHESWGAYLGRWKGDGAVTTATEQGEATVTAEQFIDASASKSIVLLTDVKPISPLHPPATEVQIARLMELSAAQGVYIDLENARGENMVDKEEEQYTLFVNAAIQGYRQKPSQLPFIVDMSLEEAPVSKM